MDSATRTEFLRLLEVDLRNFGNSGGENLSDDGPWANKPWRDFHIVYLDCGWGN